MAPLVSVCCLAACSGDSGSGPVEVKWDRDSCERCRMVLSDRRHAAQVRGGPADGKSRVYKFDDIGGAIVWLEGKDWKDDAKTELWVTDFRDGRWIDGREAVYLDGQMTPMDFGLGAQDEPVEGGISFQQVRAMVLENEEHRQRHKGQP